MRPLYGSLASVTEVAEDLQTAIKKRAGVEAQLPDLTEYMHIVQAKMKMEPGGPIGHRMLKVKVNLRVCLKNPDWREEVFPGGE